MILLCLLPPLFLFFFTYPVPIGGSKICPTYQQGRSRGWGHYEAKSPPTQRMLITCVLSQAEAGHPLWIKEEIVSRSLIFHRPEMFGWSLSSGSCAREIIWAHSGQRNPSFLVCWTASPWLLWGHLCPNSTEVLPNRTSPFFSLDIVFMSTLFSATLRGLLQQGQ